MKLAMKKIIIALMPFILSIGIASSLAAGTICDFHGGGAFGCIRTDGEGGGLP